MTKYDLIKVQICYKTTPKSFVSRQTNFIGKKDLLKNKKVSIKIRDQKIESLTLSLLSRSVLEKQISNIRAFDK